VSIDETSDNEPCVVSLLDGDVDAREALGRVLRSCGWGLRTFTTASDYLAAPQLKTPTCVVLESSLPDDTGLELQRRMHESGDLTPLVFVSGHADLATGVRAMKAGAIDFLPKPVSEPDLLAAVRAALQCDAWQRRERARRDELRRRIDSLSPREREVMRWVVRGVLNKTIALEMAIAEITVKVHRRNMMAKMGAASLADLVRMVDRAEPDGEGPCSGLAQVPGPRPGKGLDAVGGERQADA
jgi:FixJ family two-component response regulator